MVAVVFKTLDTAAIGVELHQRFADFPDFFDHDAVAIDLASAIDDNTVCADIDWALWVQMLTRYNMHPLAVRGVPESWKTQLLAHNLSWMANAAVVNTSSQQSDKPSTLGATPSPASPSVATTNQCASAMVVDKPLRSGQRVYAKGGDLVVLAMVNPGAEVIADGHIHVYAPLRGRAVAGARGDTSARIFALTFEPELVSIAGVYQSIDGDLPGGVQGSTAQVSLAVQDAQERLIYQAIAK